MNGGRRKSGQRNRWEENIIEWTGLSIAKSLRASKDRKGWCEVIRRSMMAPLQPPEGMG